MGRRAATGAGAGGGAALLLTLAGSWAAWWGAWAAGGGLGAPVPTTLYALGGVWPLLVAVAMARRSGGLRSLAARMVDPRRVPPRWWAILAAAGAGPAILAALASGPGRPGGLVAVSVAALPAIVAFNLLASAVEEPLWRGTAQDRLQARHPALLAALVVGLAWAAWHVPLYAVEGTFQHDHGMGSAAFWLYTLVLIPESVLLAWVLVHTRRSVLAAIVLHLAVNMSGEVLDLTTREQGLRLALTTGLAVAVALAAGPSLSGRRRAPADPRGTGRRAPPGAAGPPRGGGGLTA